ncbi:putative uridine kinase [Bodo saltans virus]|uniref:phosphoribulokinase n=1 Tax=Bodo saltans virus TaxID=2024608 RepID=A0A2H4UUR3_9VIRU|nr:putative uridine kinase [Bodo saltans virus]ATZ80614.1 putative uridine kinase [Bodo saltans virus]
MKLLFLFSGSIRTLVKNIEILEKKLTHINIDYDMYLYNSSDDDEKYTNVSITDVNFFKKFKIIYNDKKNFIFPKINNIFDIDNMKIINTFKQWYKLHQLFTIIPHNTYDYIIRIRPDIEILSSCEELYNIFSSLNKNTLYVPNILMHESKIIKKYDTYEHINDQFCICDYNVMQIYANFYNHLMDFQHMPFISEIILLQYLLINNVNVVKININYKLNLSPCNIIAISGDSGTGKTTLMNNIQNLLFDKYLCFETDRYHKWERNDNNWKIYTHLDPHSNFLEKMANDTYNLKMGSDIYTVDYDHSTGKFINDTKIQSKNGIILCGLHTLYCDKILNLIDIKIYIDTDEKLKKVWKLIRDTTKRKQSYEQIMLSIESREKDYQKYILPQKDHADIIVHNYCNEILDLKQYYTYNNLNINTDIFISESFYKINNHKITFRLIHFVKYNNLYKCDANLTSIMQYLKTTYNIVPTENYAILQLLLIYILFNND